MVELTGYRRVGGGRLRDETEARIFLTFDDGPDPIWTPRILEALHRSHVRATFFVL